MKKIICFLLLILLLVSCTTFNNNDTDTSVKVMFKNMIKDSEKLNEIYIKGMIRISGLKGIPAGYLNFTSEGKVKDTTLNFKISFFKTPIIEIFVEKNQIVLINHTKNKQYIKMKYEDIDFSNLIGINFNPLELSSFFLGKIPYNDKIELMDYKKAKNGYLLNITNNSSKYTIIINSQGQIINATIANQYFDTIQMNSVKYQKDASGDSYPSSLSFSAENKPVKIDLIIDKILYKSNQINFDINKYKDYVEETNINNIKIELK